MTEAAKKTVVTFSGGIDSATLVYDLLSQDHEVLALTIDYGQRHRVELQRASEIARSAGIAHEIADLRPIAHFLTGSSQTDPGVAVPLGHYEADNMKATVVPNRNMILLAVAAGWAISNKAQAVAFAAHSGDHTIYPDCRPEFADALDKAIGLADWHHVALLRPFINMTKGEIVRLAVKLGVPLEKTWSCYQGKAIHCGACGTCIERREAFLQAGVSDPTAYDAQAPTMTLDAHGKAMIDWDKPIGGGNDGSWIMDKG